MTAINILQNYVYNKALVLRPEGLLITIHTLHIHPAATLTASSAPSLLPIPMINLGTLSRLRPQQNIQPYSSSVIAKQLSCCFVLHVASWTKARAVDPDGRLPARWTCTVNP
jgi:hypothetical protein